MLESWRQSRARTCGCTIKSLTISVSLLFVFFFYLLCQRGPVNARTKRRKRHFLARFSLTRRLRSSRSSSSRVFHLVSVRTGSYLAYLKTSKRIRIPLLLSQKVTYQQILRYLVLFGQALSRTRR